MLSSIIMNKKVLSSLFFLLIGCSFGVFSQILSKGNKYPKGEFIFPINPYSPASLAGYFGDIRVNHFHAGWDIRTGGVEGKPVIAIGDGYVSRINVSTSGYGNALYITHPNGYTSVYAHLQEYSDKIKEILLKKQYESQAFQLDFNLPPHAIPVRKGEIVALSGNTGGSGGPHLHFEIRDADENAIDPAFFSFSEVQDNKHPVIEEVILVPFSMDARINGEFREVSFKPMYANGTYSIPQTILVSGKIGIKILTYDKSHTSPFRLGISDLRMLVNNKEVYHFSLEKLSFDDKLDMNTHTDYAELLSSGKKYHKCYVEDGNRMWHYKTINSGVVSVNEPFQQVSIYSSDVFSNSTAVNLSFQRQPIVTELGNAQFTANVSPSLRYEIIGDFLKVEGIGFAFESTILNVKTASSFFQKLPDYQLNGKKIYLFDLKENFISEVKLENEVLRIPINASVNENRKTIRGTNFEIDFEDALYHQQYLFIQNNGNELIIDKDQFPMKNAFTVKWQPNVPFSTKAGVYLIDKKPKFIKSEWVNNSFVFHPKELGTFSIRVDNIVPTITARTLNANKLSFSISDNLSGIKEIKCLVNNEWVLMEYEPKLGLIWSEKLHSEIPFLGNVQLFITDNAGNTAYFERQLP